MCHGKDWLADSWKRRGHFKVAGAFGRLLAENPYPSSLQTAPAKAPKLQPRVWAVWTQLVDRPALTNIRQNQALLFQLTEHLHSHTQTHPSWWFVDSQICFSAWLWMLPAGDDATWQSFSPTLYSYRKYRENVSYNSRYCLVPVKVLVTVWGFGSFHIISAAVSFQEKEC